MADLNRRTKRRNAGEDHGEGCTLMDLPEDLIADILRRLPPRYLAACRSVCSRGRDVVDGHGMLLAVEHRVPRHVRGILFKLGGREIPSFLSRTAAQSIDGALPFLPRGPTSLLVLDHHNGLILCQKSERIYVCNPATRRWRKLQPPLPPTRWLPRFAYLVFDPTVSLHYQVLLFLKPPRRHEVNTVASMAMEWPPRVYTVQVFSSREGQWEAKQFIREGVDAAITVSDVLSDPWAPRASRYKFRRFAVYWRQRFYLHCHGGFVMRLSLLDGKYVVIPTPKLYSYVSAGENNKYPPYVYLAKSEQGVYFTAIARYNLFVWVLQETSNSSSCGMPRWELKHKADLRPSFVQINIQYQSGQQIKPSWILDPRQEGSETNNNSRNHDEWCSDDDGDIEVTVNDDHDDDKARIPDGYYSMCLLGYHPYKEILFLGCNLKAYAYFLRTSKLQYLGSLNYNSVPFPLRESFIYTPCMDDLLPTRLY